MKIKLSDHFTYGRLLRFCLPSVIMMVFTSIYGVVDGFFVSNFAGKVSFAAINLVMPFIMILGGLGFMIGAGGSALAAKTLGEGDKKRASQYFSMLVHFTVICGIITTVIGIIFMRPIAQMLGATPAMLDDCVIYGRTVMAFNIAFMLQNVFQTFLTTAEKPKLGLMATLAAGITNMVLDAVFVGVFRWGVTGAAAATGISQCVGGILPLIYFARPNSSLLRLSLCRMDAGIIIKACTNGASELMTSISGSIVSMLYNFQLLRFAGENGVAAYGVLMYVQFIFIAVFIGYNIGTAPVVGYNYGSGNNAELKNMLRKSLVVMGSAGTVMMVTAQALSYPLAGIFVGYDAQLLAMTHRAFGIFSLSFIIAGFNIFASSFFTALGNGAVSAGISFMRTLVFQMAAVLILPLILRIDGIWWATTAAELLALAVSAFFLVKKKNTYHYA